MATYDTKFKTAVNPETGERLILAVDPNDPSKGQWVPESEKGNVKPWEHRVKTNNPQSAFTQRVQKFQDQKTRWAQRWADENLMDPRRQMDREAAQDISGPEAFSINAIREAAGFGRGARDLVTNLAGLGAGVLNLDSQDALMQKTRENEQAKIERDRLWQGFDDTTFGADLGKVVPYLLTGRVIEPAARATTGRALSQVGEVAVDTAKQSGGFLSKLIKNQAATGSPRNPVTRVAKELEESVVDPLQKFSANLKARPVMEDDFRKGFLSQTGTYGGIGATEGAIHEDLTIPGGSGGSMIGGVLGRFASPMMSKLPNKNSDSVNALLDEMEAKGFRSLPGLRSGQPELQILENNLRTDRGYSSYFRDIDNANNEVVTRTAVKAMGITDDVARDLTPARLKAHRESLKNEFDELEKVSIGKLDRTELQQIDQEIANLGVSNNVKTMQQELKNMKHTRGRSATGQFTPATFSGKDYKRLTAKIKLARDSAQVKGNLEDASVYDKMLTALDNGMHTGVVNHGGAGTGAKWKDLRQRYALTELIEQHGMTPMGGIDTGRLGKYFIEHDSRRLLEGSEGPISDLHKLAKLNYIQKKQSGGGLGRDNVEDDFYTGVKDQAHLLGTPASLMMPLQRRIPAMMYGQLGWPVKTGLLGMNKDAKYWGMPTLSRSFEQGQELHTDPVGAAKRTARRTAAYGIDMGQDVWDWMNELLEESAQKRRAEQK